MPTDKTYDKTMKALEELEDELSEEYPQVAETLMSAKTQLEEEHDAMAGDEESPELPPDLEGDEEIEGEEEIPGGPIGELPPGLEDEEEEEDEEMPPII